jgi:predicted RNase H-like nuclease (RuvC/YqgF family)
MPTDDRERDVEARVREALSPEKRAEVLAFAGKMQNGEIPTMLLTKAAFDQLTDELVAARATIERLRGENAKMVAHIGKQVERVEGLPRECSQAAYELNGVEMDLELCVKTQGVLRQAGHTISTLTAELAEARKDSERLDWLEANSRAFSSAIEMDAPISLEGRIGQPLRSRIDATRAALDAARRTGT